MTRRDDPAAAYPADLDGGLVADDEELSRWEREDQQRRQRQAAELGQHTAYLMGLPPVEHLRAACAQLATPTSSERVTEALLRVLVNLGMAQVKQALTAELAELVDDPGPVDDPAGRRQRRAEATGGGPCRTCGRPRWTHVCLGCSPDAQTPGPGCVRCRHTGMDQTPCQPPGANPPQP